MYPHQKVIFLLLYKFLSLVLINGEVNNKLKRLIKHFIFKTCIVKLDKARDKIEEIWKLLVQLINIVHYNLTRYTIATKRVI